MSAGCGTIMTRSYMPGLFEALAKMPKREPKRFFITVQGTEHQVTLEKKLWAQHHGEENLMLRDGEIVVKPTPKPKTQYSTLTKSSEGYFFMVAIDSMMRPIPIPQLVPESEEDMDEWKKAEEIRENMLSKRNSE